MLDIKVPIGTKIAVITDCHEHSEQFFKLLDIIKPQKNMWLVSLGDLYDRGFGKDKAELMVRKIRELNELGIGYMVNGNHELRNIRRAKEANRMTPELEWLDKQPFVISFVFSNNTRLTCLHGGVKQSFTWDNLRNNDTNLAYIRYLDENGNQLTFDKTKVDGKTIYKMKAHGKMWHEFYDGRFGYIASGHEPQKDGAPKYYKYSCNLDTGCYDTGLLTAQIFSENGREEMIQVSGRTTGDHEVYDR